MTTILTIENKSRISRRKKRQGNGDKGYLETETDLVKENVVASVYSGHVVQPFP